MSFPRYPKSKASGVEWLGEVPEHWEVRRLKNLVDEPLKYGANESAELDDRTLPRFVRITDITDSGSLRDETFKSLPAEVAEPYLLKEGDVLLARSGATVGKSFIYSKQWGTACFAGYLIRARLHHTTCLAPWLYYFCQTDRYWGYVIGSQIQTTIQNVSAEKYANLYLPLPSVPEQASITAFLDRETAKIDRLIAEQERLMSLLTEKVKSLALSSFELPNTKHLRFGSVVQIISRPVIQKEGEEYTRIGLYNRGRGLFHKDASEKDDMGDSDFFWIEDGDLILSGQFAWEGAVALASKEDTGCVVSHRYPVLRGKSGVVLTEYLLALLSTKHGDFLLNENSRGAAGRNRPLNINSLLKEKIPVPDMQIQEKVARAIHWRDILFREISKQIELLKERRTALISVVVTGQVDVRPLLQKESA